MIVQDFDLDEEELEECVTYYLDHVAIQGSKIQEIVSKIKSICSQFTGDAEAGHDQSADGKTPSTQELPLDTLLDVLESFAEKTKDCFGKFAAEFVQNFGVPSSQGDIARFAEKLTLVSDRCVLP